MTSHERRTSPREALRLPVRWLAVGHGWTRDVAPEGLYVELPGHPIVLRWCALEIGYPQARLRFRAVAEVLRVEPGPDTTGVALRLRARTFQRDP